MKKLFVLCMFIGACGGGGQKTNFPERPAGCAVTLIHGTPTMKTTNIGPVRAYCDKAFSETDCQRTLMDQVCKLGGDVVWEVPMTPTDDGDKKVWTGRAARSADAAP